MVPRRGPGASSGPFFFAPTRKNPRQSTHAWGSGEFVTARLLTRQQGASGDGGCCPVGQCAFDEDFLLGKQPHLGMRRSAAYLRAGIEPILRRSISPAETSRYASGEDRLAELSDCGKS